jgi:hypothetical protein
VLHWYFRPIVGHRLIHAAGAQAERYSAALRADINDLARFYNLTPMGI